jgi:hypothetical protein
LFHAVRATLSRDPFQGRGEALEHCDVLPPG